MLLRATIESIISGTDDPTNVTLYFLVFVCVFCEILPVALELDLEVDLYLKQELSKSISDHYRFDMFASFRAYLSMCMTPALIKRDHLF